MTNININKDKISHTVYIALLVAVGALVLLLGIGTIFGLLRSGSEPVLTLGGTESAHTFAQGSPHSQEDDIRVFSGLGRLRIPLVNSSTLLVAIAFPYDASDIAFTEELAAKVGDFRMLATGYFSALPVESAEQVDDEAAKREILRLFNGSLRLGRIEALYLTDLMVLDTAR
ncbi:MAG: hypothetical protein FWC01_04420 [Treponema sp.]|nr:hypothetical protein [Treponema sp.]MCL2237195.1 hypothetical protein [Treponema sp.]